LLDLEAERTFGPAWLRRAMLLEAKRLGDRGGLEIAVLDRSRP